MAWANSHGDLIFVVMWVFSALMSSMPPLPPDSPWAVVWLHSFLQAVSANLNKVRTPTRPAEPAQPNP